MPGPVPRYSRSKVTDLVTPRTVRSATTLYWVSLTLVTEVLFKVRVGLFS